jgi:hypothetical protein
MFVGLVCKHTGASCVDARIARGRSPPLAAAHERCRSSHARSPRSPLAATRRCRSLAAARRPLARRSLPLAARSPLPLARRALVAAARSLPLAARSLAAARRPLARRSLPLAARSSLPLARCRSPPACRGAVMHWAARTQLCALHAHVGMPKTHPDCCAALHCGVSAEAGWWSRGRRVCVPARAGGICGGSRRVRSSRAVQWLMREGQEYISPMHWERERDTAGRHSGERGVLGGRLVWRWRGWMQAER